MMPAASCSSGNDVVGHAEPNTACEDAPHLAGRDNRRERRRSEHYTGRDAHRAVKARELIRTLEANGYRWDTSRGRGVTACTFIRFAPRWRCPCMLWAGTSRSHWRMPSSERRVCDEHLYGHLRRRSGRRHLGMGSGDSGATGMDETIEQAEANLKAGLDIWIETERELGRGTPPPAVVGTRTISTDAASSTSAL